MMRIPTITTTAFLFTCIFLAGISSGYAQPETNDSLEQTKETMEMLGLDSAKLAADYQAFIDPDRRLESHEKNNGIMTFGKQYENLKLSELEKEFITRGKNGKLCKEGEHCDEALKNTLHALLALNICCSADAMNPDDRRRYILLGFFVLQLYQNNPVNKQVTLYEPLQDAPEIALSSLRKPYGEKWSADIVQRAAYLAEKYPVEFTVCAGIGIMGLSHLGGEVSMESLKQWIEKADMSTQEPSSPKTATPSENTSNKPSNSPSTNSSSPKPELKPKPGERVQSFLVGGTKKSIAISEVKKFSNRSEWTLTTASGIQKTLTYYPNSPSAKKYSIGISNYYTKDEALGSFIRGYK